MFRLLVKKWIFNSWDHFLALLMFNIGFIALLLSVISLFSIIGEIHILLFLLLFISIVLITSVYSGFVSSCLTQLIEGKSNLYLLPILKKASKFVIPSLFLGIFHVGCFLVLQISIPFYAAMHNFLGAFIIGILFWATVLWLLISQFYLPLLIQIGGSVRSTLRKSLLLFFDNSRFAIALLATGTGILLLSIFTAFLFPGIAGFLLLFQTGVRLRLYKYDHSQKESPDWNKLLREEKEKLQGRTIRNVLFPWKD